MSTVGVRLMNAAELLDGITPDGLEAWIGEVAEHGGPRFNAHSVRQAINSVRCLGHQAARLLLSETTAYEALLRAQSTTAAGVEMFRHIDAARAKVAAMGGTLTVVDRGDSRPLFGIAFDDGDRIQSIPFDTIDELVAEVDRLGASAQAVVGAVR